MKKALLNHLAQCAGHEVAMGKLHRSRAEGSDGTVAEFHKAASEAHATQAEHYLKLYKQVESGETPIDSHDNSSGINELKVSGPFGMTATRDFTKIKPDGVKMIMPEDIPGHALPTKGQHDVDVRDVSPEFRHLVEL